MSQIGQTHFGKVKGYTMMMHTLTPNQYPYQVSTLYILRNPRNNLDNILTPMVTTRSKLKLRSHHDVAHLQPSTNDPTRYQLPTLYIFKDIVWTKF